MGNPRQHISEHGHQTSEKLDMFGFYCVVFYICMYNKVSSAIANICEGTCCMCVYEWDERGRGGGGDTGWSLLLCIAAEPAHSLHQAPDALRAVHVFNCYLPILTTTSFVGSLLMFLNRSLAWHHWYCLGLGHLHSPSVWFLTISVTCKFYDGAPCVYGYRGQVCTKYSKLFKNTALWISSAESKGDEGKAAHFHYPRRTS